MFRLAVVALALLALPLAHLAAQTPGERVRALGQASGHSLAGPVLEGALPRGGERPIAVQLTAGSSYVAAGFCDESCSDLDLLLLDPTRRQVAQDVAVDAEAVLRFTAEASGRYEIWAVVVECSTPLCGFALGVFETGERAPVDLGGSLEERLDAFRIQFEGQGFRGVGQGQVGALNSGGEVRFPLELQAGVQYRIAGACDNNCENLDLTLLDPDGAAVVADLMEDAIPVLEHAAATAGAYWVKVNMVACGSDPCEYGVSHFARGGPAAEGAAASPGEVVSDVTHQGSLEESDRRLGGGEFYDEYTVEARAGQIILLDLRSREFDTFLVLRAPGGSAEENDDLGNDSGRSYLRVTAAETGTYTIMVTSFEAGERGAYTLRAVVLDAR